MNTGACEIQMKVLGPLELDLVGKCKLVGFASSRHERRTGKGHLNLEIDLNH